ncbi:hypothetical protein NCTC12673_gp009 [Campylobacter phage NCTC12673]|uniref:Uncharacterized protein n=2 Tax=Fletchervirus NCTC12673 TaxID=934027 RepID=A0A1B0XW52_9CAUD|nr:hypothetical protein NCTC12673_gp009 [Campylobacter phage NCTC12673]YP_009321665.1 hypothetical protein BOX06_gp066 [Campylobacter phage PC14]AEA86357.1 hypothetical protein [Campylobacter phage NCTC12673]ANH51359.1 hypothetical protein PC14_00066 [Campylobacter phage PC14]
MSYSFEQYCNSNNFNEFQIYLITQLSYINNKNVVAIQDPEYMDVFKAIKQEYYKASSCKHSDKEEVIPEHYTKLAIEPIDFIYKNNLNFCEGNIVKYVSRLGSKDDNKSELKKIFFYFDYLLHGNYDLTKRTFS